MLKVSRAREIKAVEAKLEVLGRFKETVGKIEVLVDSLSNFDGSLKAIDSWMQAATAELKDIKEASGSMLPEDRVARTMDLQEDIAAKIEILKTAAAQELDLLPQGDKVPADAQGFKDELNRITKYVTDLAENTRIECDNTPMMSNSGQNTELALRNLLLGWSVQKRQLVRDLQNHPLLMKSRLLMIRFFHLTKTVLTISRFSLLLRLLLSL